MNDIIGFTTWGRYDGQCGHLHRLKADAEGCLITANIAFLKMAGRKMDRCIASVRRDSHVYDPTGKKRGVFRKSEN